MTTSTPEPTVTAAEIQELRMDFDTYRIHRALDALEAAWAREAQLVAALRAADGKYKVNMIGCAIIHGVRGWEGEYMANGYGIRAAMHAIVAAVDARETKGADHA